MRSAAGRPSEDQRRPSPPGESKILVIVQGFSGLLGGVQHPQYRAGHVGLCAARAWLLGVDGWLGSYDNAARLVATQ
jgi:hypothetical protein